MKLDAYLELSNYDILRNSGSILAKDAKMKAENEYELFRTRQDDNFLSDFDEEMKRLSK